MGRLVKKSEAKRVGEHTASHFFEYALPFARFSLGVSEINGRYPDSGFDVDTEVDAAWYVESGEGVVFIRDAEYRVASGDMVFVAKGEKFWIDGALRLVVASSPLWTPEQHRHVS